MPLVLVNSEFITTLTKYYRGMNGDDDDNVDDDDYCLHHLTSSGTRLIRSLSVLKRRNRTLRCLMLNGITGAIPHSCPLGRDFSGRRCIWDAVWSAGATAALVPPISGVPVPGERTAPTAISSLAMAGPPNE